MLTSLLSLPTDPGRIFDFLYGIFRRDFVDSVACLGGKITIDPQSHRLEDGKEATFWHLTTSNQEIIKKVGNRYVTVKERLTDYRRSERLEWVKLIIVNHDSSRIKLFYHQEVDKKCIRLYLWAFADDFVVILQKLGKSSSFLVTSFHVSNQRKRNEYQRRYDRYSLGGAAELKGCEWL